MQSKLIIQFLFLSKIFLDASTNCTEEGLKVVVEVIDFLSQFTSFRHFCWFRMKSLPLEASLNFLVPIILQLGEFTSSEKLEF